MKRTRTALETEHDGWRAEVHRLCLREDFCADELGFVWRHQVSAEGRASKAAGRCLCEEARRAGFELECDFSLDLVADGSGGWRPGPPATLTVRPQPGDEATGS